MIVEAKLPVNPSKYSCGFRIVCSKPYPNSAGPYTNFRNLADCDAVLKILGVVLHFNMACKRNP